MVPYEWIVTVIGVVVNWLVAPCYTGYMEEVGTLVGALLVGLALYGLLRLGQYVYYMVLAWFTEETDER